ncbi:MAG: MoaD/ThiS family protein, partial [Pyrinomonadaceae bacterium]
RQPEPLADGSFILPEGALAGGSVTVRDGFLKMPGGRVVRIERGEIRRHINVFVNGERGDAATAVSAGDSVEVLPAISGGWCP